MHGYQNKFLQCYSFKIAKVALENSSQLWGLVKYVKTEHVQAVIVNTQKYESPTVAIATYIVLIGSFMNKHYMIFD